MNYGLWHTSMKFKILIIFFGILPSSINNFVQNDIEIIGTWNYVETRDSSGKKIKTYNRGFGEITASGPQITYNSDFSYKMVFTPKNTDKGHWRFEKSNLKVVHQLYIDSTDIFGKYLIKMGEAKKHTDGKYYEIIETKLSKLTNDEMIVVSRDVFEVYRKLK
jgi:hypothetical protein